MTKDEALTLALEALELHGAAYLHHELRYEEAITTAKEALALMSTTCEVQPEHEPWCMKMNGCKTKCADCPDKPVQKPDIYPEEACDIRLEAVAYYTTPPKREWVGLTDEEIKILWIQYRAALPRYICFARAVLAKSKELNT